MKKVIMIVILFIPFNIYSFEPPVDILKYDYEQFQKEDDNIVLEDGYLVIEEKYEYYGTSISYSINFNKRDPESFYIFYECPYNKLEVFNEFYRDYLLYYKGKSDFIKFNDEFDLKESEPIFKYYVDNEKPILVYRKESMENGFRGFGVTQLDEKYNGTLGEVLKEIDYLDFELNDLDGFLPEEIYKTSIFINEKIASKSINFTFTEDMLNSAIGKTFLLQTKQNKEYELKIEGANSQQLKEIFIGFSNSYLISLSEILNIEDYTISSYNDYILIVIFKDKEVVPEKEFTLLVNEKDN